ncbi:putative DnaJ domain containing protein [Blattamonas nauphoetae]|uniref:DnaJ domain containing protein n=1 Tax=Blattamonas nauphoetae TaxID=2049346 RepID=A0ABQ9XMJ5_9EUKA|nr:putative DnaJ domain containing protein [Blattamonas nauphoetae]
MIPLLLFWTCACQEKEPDPYKVLGIPETANDYEIKQRFRELSKKYHPDRNKDGENTDALFKKITHAYETIATQEKRDAYQRQKQYGFSPYNPGQTRYSTQPFDPFEFFTQFQQQNPKHRQNTFHFGGKTPIFMAVVMLAFIVLFILAFSCMCNKILSELFQLEAQNQENDVELQQRFMREMMRRQQMLNPQQNRHYQPNAAPRAHQT